MKKTLRISLLILGLLASSASAYGQDNLPPNVDSGWLANLNYYRVSAGLNPVTEDKQLSASVKKHLVYLVMSDPKYFVGPYLNLHSENPASPYYTPQGVKSGNELTSTQSGSPSEAIDSWMQAPFHAIGLMREGLKSVGFAREFNPKTGFYEFGMNIFAKLSTGKSKILTFPGNGSYSHMDTFQGENPDPRIACGADSQKYKGMPLWVSLLTPPPLQVSAELTTPSGNVLRSGADLCVVTERNFLTTDPVYGPAGRSIITNEHLALVIPKEPLMPGLQKVSLSMQGRPDITWSFTVIGTPPAITWTATQAPEVINWNAPPIQSNDPIAGYDVMIGNVAMTSIQSFRTTTTSFATTTLDPAQYWVCVKAIGEYRSGTCPYFSSYTIQRNLGSVPLNSTLSYPTKIAIDPILDNPTKVTWQLPAMPTTGEKVIQSIKLKIRIAGSNTEFFSTDLPIATQEFAPPSLDPGDYQMCVTAENLYGASACQWEDFSVIPKQKQTLLLSFPYAGNLALPGSSTTISADSYLNSTAMSLTPKVCSTISLKGQIQAKAKIAGSCLLHITNPGDNLNSPLDENQKISIAKLIKIKCVKKNRSIFFITGYNPKCPAV